MILLIIFMFPSSQVYSAEDELKIHPAKVLCQKNFIPFSKATDTEYVYTSLGYCSDVEEEIIDTTILSEVGGDVEECYTAEENNKKTTEKEESYIDTCCFWLFCGFFDWWYS